MRYTFLFLFTLLFSISSYADDSIWLYKKAFVETYHINKNCPVIKGKKVKAYSLSDETDTRQLMRNALQLADHCTVCRTPNIRGTRDSRLDDLLAEVLGRSLSYEEDEEDTTTVDIPFSDTSFFDDEIIISMPEGGKVSSKVFKERGHRFKMFEVKRAYEERLIGSPVTCEVVYTHKSTIFGKEGELIVRPLYLTTDDGTVIRLKHDDIYVRGKNRQNLKFWTFPSIVTWFLPGQGARIKEADEYVVTLDPTSDTSADGMIRRERDKAKEEAEHSEAQKSALQDILNR